MLWLEPIFFGNKDLFSSAVGVTEMRVLTTVQTVLTLYLSHVTFYSAKNACWDRLGYFVHLVAAIIVFFALPVAIIAIGIHSLTESPKSPFIPLLLTMAFSSAQIILVGII